MIAVGNLKNTAAILIYIYIYIIFLMAITYSCVWRDHCPVRRYFFFRGHLPEKPLILALKELWRPVRQSI